MIREVCQVSILYLRWQTMRKSDPGKGKPERMITLIPLSQCIVQLMQSQRDGNSLVTFQPIHGLDDERA
jgi:hypothetical protein